jgi:hypothetical protein
MKFGKIEVVLNKLYIARVAELVYAHDLKSCLVRDAGSIPAPGTGSSVKDGP